MNPEHISGPISRLKKRKFKLTAPGPSEADEQIRVVTWARFYAPHYPDLKLLYAVPNGAIAGPGRFHIVVWMKNMGMVSGVPDLVLPVRRGPVGGLYLEMKKRKGGTLDANQKWWAEQLTNQRYRVAAPKGAEAAIQIIRDYLDFDEREAKP